MYRCVFLHIGIFFSSGREVFSGALGPGARREPSQTPRRQVWALVRVRGTCSRGSKSQVTTGRHSEHVEPSRSTQTHVQVKNMSDGSCDI